MFRLIQDNDCHWYVIPAEKEEEFDDWVMAQEDCEPWIGHDYNADRVDGPHRVTFPSFVLDEE